MHESKPEQDNLRTKVLNTMLTHRSDTSTYPAKCTAGDFHTHALCGRKGCKHSHESHQTEMIMQVIQKEINVQQTAVEEEVRRQLDITRSVGRRQGR